jgi:hypothetical protein
MNRYFCAHSFPPSSLTHEQVCQIGEASQHEEHVRGYRSFLNLSLGKVWCVMEADSREALVAWFDKMKIPYDSIDLVELEGEHGLIHDLKEAPAMV